MRLAALSTAILVLGAACTNAGTSAENERAETKRSAPISVPSAGVFATTEEHFDGVIASGELPTVVNAWASWCIPCRAETPLLVERAARYDGRIRFLGLNTQDDRKAALEFIDEFAIPYPSGLDPKGTIARHLSILGLPATLFYKPGGDLALVHQGEIRAPDLDEKIEELLRASKGA